MSLIFLKNIYLLLILYNLFKTSNDLNDNNSVKLFIHQLILISICNQNILSIEEKKEYIIHLCKKLCKVSKNNTNIDFFQSSKNISKDKLSKEKIIFPFNKLLEIYTISNFYLRYSNI